MRGLGAFIGSYLKKKGENLATQEDVQKLTTLVEEVKATISDRVWDRQKQWEMKRDAIFATLEALGEGAMMKKHLLKSPLTVIANIQTALDEGLKARNLLIHRVLIDNVEMFVTPESRAALVEKIRALRRKVNAADKKLRPVTGLLADWSKVRTCRRSSKRCGTRFFEALPEHLSN